VDASRSAGTVIDRLPPLTSGNAIYLVLGYVQRRLSEQTELLVPPTLVQREARETINQWAGSDDGIKTLRRGIDPTYYHTKDLAIQDSFSRYLENMVVHTWPALVGPHDIFERRNIPAISRVIGVSQKDLRLVHKLSKDEGNLRRFAKELPFDDDEFLTLWRAYLTDLLIRGRYHDESARMGGGQILHHPARNPVLRSLSGKRTRYSVGNTERAFSGLLIAGSFGEITRQRRIDLWLDNVLLARLAARKAALDLTATDTREAAERAAVMQARQIGVRTHARLFDDLTDATIAAGSGLLTSFVVTGWADVAISVAMYAAAKSEELGIRAGRILFERRKRLQKFTASEAGRIEREWS